MTNPGDLVGARDPHHLAHPATRDSSSYPVNKVFLPLGGRPVVLRSIEATRQLSDIGPRVLVVAEQDVAAAKTLLSTGSVSDIRLVRGGSSRHQSERNALEELAPQIEDGDVDLVVIHDSARPLASPSLFADVIKAARAAGGALPVRPAPPLVSLEHPDALEQDADVVTVQTPQAFRARPLLEAHRAAALAGFDGTDTASCIERFTDIQVKGVIGHDANIKLTFAEDLLLAERLLVDADRC